MISRSVILICVCIVLVELFVIYTDYTSSLGSINQHYRLQALEKDMEMIKEKLDGR